MNIQLEDIAFSYRSKVGGSRPALEQCSMIVESGESVGIIGHEGAGKTTLLQLIDGLLKPRHGRLIVDGRNVWNNPKYLLEHRRQIGFSFQFPEQQFFCETVAEELTFALENSGMSTSLPSYSPAEVLSMFGLSPGDVLERSPFSLSMGEARRVALASLLIARPRVLLLDEPTAGLDGRGVESIVTLLRRLVLEGMTLIIVSHDVDVLAELVSRVIIMHHGKIAVDLPASRLLKDQNRLRDYGYDLPEVMQYVAELRGKGVAIEDSFYTIDQARRTLARLSENSGQRPTSGSS
jgi:energy-coupling factor transport system ATP-binding protein